MKKPLLVCQNIDVILEGQIILRDISFEVQKKEIVALIGLNGSGKTTLLKAILGLCPISRGFMKVNTKNVAYVPQRIDVDRTIPITVKELLETYSNASKKAIQEKLKEIDAGHLLDRQVGQLSGGELQRVLIANALLSKPDLLLLDEATAGIDVKGEQNFYELVSKIHKDYDLAIMIVSHDIHAIYKNATRILCLHNCSIICKGSTKHVMKEKAFSEIFEQEHRPFTHHHD